MKKWQNTISSIRLILRAMGILLVLYNVGIVDLFIDNALVNIGINVILAVGLNLIIGYSGQFSLGHAGFMAMGRIRRSDFCHAESDLRGFSGHASVGALLSGIPALGVGIPTLRLKVGLLGHCPLGGGGNHPEFNRQFRRHYQWASGDFRYSPVHYMGDGLWLCGVDDFNRGELFTVVLAGASWLYVKTRLPQSPWGQYDEVQSYGICRCYDCQYGGTSFCRL